MLKVDWGNEQKTYIYSQFHPSWTWQDVSRNRQEYNDMVSSVNHRVDYIGDFTNASLVPSNMFANVTQIFNSRLPNEGYIILIGASSTVKRTFQIVEAIVKSLNDYLVFADTLEEALQMTCKNRNAI